MPEISEQDFAALAAQVASLSSALAVARRRIDDLEEGMTDHIGLDWGESLVDVNSPHPNISANTIESGGGIIRQDIHGMQVAAGGSAVTSVYLVPSLSADPESAAIKGKLGGYIDPTESSDAETYLSLTSDESVAELHLYRSDTHAQALLKATSPAGNAQLIAQSLDTAPDQVYVGVTAGAFLLASTISPSQITSTQNDYTPTDLATSIALRLSSDASRDITGITGGLGGRLLFVFNVGSFDIVLKDEDAGSDAANRFALQADITVPPDGAAILWYDSASSRWRCVGTY